jgi:serine/threonine protein kinase
LLGTIFAGRYRVVNLLGRGGMGEVYRATDLVLHQTVALKFLPEFSSHDQKARERFLNEVRAAREITHPNVCRVHDIGELYGHLYLSMEFVDGEDLASLLARIGRLLTACSTASLRR